jgi:hypothetical protein
MCSEQFIAGFFFRTVRYAGNRTGSGDALDDLVCRMCLARKGDRRKSMIQARCACGVALLFSIGINDRVQSRCHSQLKDADLFALARDASRERNRRPHIATNRKSLLTLFTLRRYSP